MRKILLYKTTIVLVLICFCSGFLFSKTEADWCSDNFCDVQGPTSFETVCCEDGITCYQVGYGAKGGGCQISPTSPTCTASRSCFFCPFPQPSVCGPWVNKVYTDYGCGGSCSPEANCCACWESFLGECSTYCGDGTCDDDEDPVSCPDDCTAEIECELQWPGGGASTCPATCTKGGTFEVSYEVKTQDNTTEPWLWRRIDYKRLLLENVIAWCDEPYVPDNNWHLETKTVACDEDLEMVSPNVEVRCHSNSNPEPGWCIATIPTYSPEYDDILSCYVEPIDRPSSTGHIRIQGPSGVIKLNIISAADAISAGRGVVKVAMTAGDVNSAADLVETNDPDASPVRIMTPFGIKAWKKLIP